MYTEKGNEKPVNKLELYLIFGLIKVKLMVNKFDEVYLLSPINWMIPLKFESRIHYDVNCTQL